jgi:hypothetical protein
MSIQFDIVTGVVRTTDVLRIVEADKHEHSV